MEIRGARCLVTGATSGIGRALALELGRRGASLFVTGRDPVALAELAELVGARSLGLDLTAPGAVAQLRDAAGDIDIAVWSAGAGQYGSSAGLEADEIARLVDLNVTAPLALTAGVLPGMLERHRGQVVLVGSIAGRLGRGRESVYAGTKAAVSVFADSLRAELRGTGVDVLLVTPGPVDTPFFERRGTPYDRLWPRPIAPERVARAVIAGIESGRAEVTVPRWLSVPVRLRGAAPALYRVLAGRFD